MVAGVVVPVLGRHSAPRLADCLTLMSENATLNVMTSNAGAHAAGQGSPFFPPQAPATTPPTTATAAPTSVKTRVAAVPGLNPSHLGGANSAELQQLLEGLLGALKNVSDQQLQLGERHGDGGLQITSHVAVWLIGQVTEAYGGKLVRLSKVSTRESLRSTAGLAVLLRAAITEKQGSATT